MLDQSTRAAILKLQQQGHSIRGIARAMKLSRGAVRQVLRSATEIVPRLVRPEKATPYREQILELYARCKGNLVRVHEELVVAGAQLSYQALTAFCRRQGIGQQRKQPVGEYHFEPGQEMQHDTSPHRVEIGGQLRLVQTASLVVVLLPHTVFPVLSHLYPLRLQGVPQRCSPVLRRKLRHLHDRQHPCGGVTGHRPGYGARAGDGRVCRALPIPFPGARKGRRQSLRPRGEKVLVHRKQLSGGPLV